MSQPALDAGCVARRVAERTARTPRRGSFAREELQPRLEHALCGAARKRVVVALTTQGETAVAAVSSDAWSTSDPADEPFQAGCVTKLLTAELVCTALETQGLGVSSEVADLIPSARRHSVLAGITVRHLLEHTHAIDDSAAGAAAPLAHGRIDVDGLLRRVRRCDARRPGELYSYSDVGFWLAAAAVENVTGRPLAAALCRELAAHGVPDRSRGTQPSSDSLSVCASRGAELSLSARELGRFVEASVARRAARVAAFGVTPLPGWNVVERGVHLGWKHYGRCWFGHNSVVRGASLLVRVQAHTGAAVVIASRDHEAALIAVKLFAALLPELGQLDIPKPLPREQAAGLDLCRHCGDYASAARSIRIEPADGELVMCFGAVRATLVPAANGLFLARPFRPGLPACVQFVRSAGQGRGFVWDGQQLLARRG